jgi:hypothetical protein
VGKQKGERRGRGGLFKEGLGLRSGLGFRGGARSNGRGEHRALPGLLAGARG